MTSGTGRTFEGASVLVTGGTRGIGKTTALRFAALGATAACLHDSLIADLIAIAASLDPVMGDVDR